jgi:phosphatidate cytidylyltransferase
MKQRITTAIIALAVLGGLLFYMPPIVVRVFIAVLLLAGAWEWSGFLGKGSVATRLAYVTLIGALIVATATLLAPHTTTVLLASLSWWAIALLWTFFFPTPIPMMVRWLVGALVLVPLYAALMLLYAADPMILLFALLIVWVADSGAYVAGKTLGRVKLAPQISPGKTWEGVIGGLVAVVLLIGLRNGRTRLRMSTRRCSTISSRPTGARCAGSRRRSRSSRRCGWRPRNPIRKACSTSAACSWN